MELPWKRNLRNVSCIPVGKYRVIKHVSPTFGRCFWVKDVPDRAEVLIHAGNFYTNTRGCILPGLDLGDINADGKKDVKDSKKALSKLLALLPDEFELEIINGLHWDK
ncbi:hypothetical protein E0K83_03910 [Gramella sp. BOM4]|nr:hypothetical protein [Christiangramia bathymodioli]